MRDRRTRPKRIPQHQERLGRVAITGAIMSTQSSLPELGQRADRRDESGAGSHCAREMAMDSWAAGFQLVMIPSNDLLMIASSDDRTTLASKAAISAPFVLLLAGDDLGLIVQKHLGLSTVEHRTHRAQEIAADALQIDGGARRAEAAVGVDIGCGMIAVEP